MEDGEYPIGSMTVSVGDEGLVELGLVNETSGYGITFSVPATNARAISLALWQAADVSDALLDVELDELLQKEGEK